MNIVRMLNKEHSKAATDSVVQYIGNDSERFNELMRIFLEDSNRIAQRAGWPVSYCVEAHPELIKPWLGKLIVNIREKDVHDSVKRNTVRLLQFVKIPKRYQGKVVDMCMEFLGSSKEPIAVRVFSMTVLANICKDFPELKDEVSAIIKDHLPYSSAGFRARAKAVLKQLDHIKK